MSVTTPNHSQRVSRRALAPRIPRTGRTDLATRNIAFWSSLAVAPAVIGLGVAALSRSKRLGAIAAGISAVGLAATRWQMQRWFTAEPDYVVERRVGKLEIRRYLPHVEALTRIDGATFEDALRQGFRRLAGYIFGGNVEREKLAMTAPVLSRPQQLAMTSPVISRVTGGEVVVTFVMPRGHSLASLPQPDDLQIELVEVPERRVAVLRGHGRYSASVVREHELELRRLLADAKLATRGEPMFAGFDPPWTLPLLRRNETWIELI